LNSTAAEGNVGWMLQVGGLTFGCSYAGDVVLQ